MWNSGVWLRNVSHGVKYHRTTVQQLTRGGISRGRMRKWGTHVRFRRVPSWILARAVRWNKEHAVHRSIQQFELESVALPDGDFGEDLASPCFLDGLDDALEALAVRNLAVDELAPLLGRNPGNAYPGLDGEPVAGAPHHSARLRWSEAEESSHAFAAEYGLLFAEGLECFPSSLEGGSCVQRREFPAEDLPVDSFHGSATEARLKREKRKHTMVPSTVVHAIPSVSSIVV